MRYNINDMFQTILKGYYLALRWFISGLMSLNLIIIKYKLFLNYVMPSGKLVPCFAELSNRMFAAYVQLVGIW